MDNDENNGIESFRQTSRFCDGADWRWRLARRRASFDRCYRSSRDPIVDRITACLMLEERTGDGEPPQSVIDSDWRELFHVARQYRENPSDRRVLEILIAGGLATSEIAKTTSLSLEALAVYEACYVDVRDILDSPSAVVTAITETSLSVKGDLIREELIRMSCLGGPTVARGCVDYLCHVDEPADLTTDIGRQRQQLRAILGAHELANAYRPPIDVRSHIAYLSAEKASRNLPTISDLVRQRLATRLRDCPVPSLTVGTEETGPYYGHSAQCAMNAA